MTTQSVVEKIWYDVTKIMIEHKISYSECKNIIIKADHWYFVQHLSIGAIKYSVK